MRLSPQVPEAPGRLGMLYVDQGRYGEAIPLLRQALQMEPRFAAVRSDLARALRQEAEALRGRGQRAEAKTLEAEADTVQGAGPGGPGATPGR